ncbi:MAG TPA: crotonase/enoyl-CoA hydratase family protein [Acidimicrobiales bacterium]|nr:crotonase/enoyl-CoA hydratase family protein [Acidimicrobiales bacterium]
MDSENRTIELDQIGRVLRITLNRPQRHNPLSPRCIREITSAIADAERDSTVHVIVIRGSGPSFSSGYGVVPGDLSPEEAETMSRPKSLESDVHDMIGIGRSWDAVWECSIPVIAQVHGHCLAGGTDLALHCDLVVCANDTTIGFPPVRSMGVPPTNMWLYHLGPQWTKRLLLTGDTITGEEAARIGLAVESVPADVLDDHVLRLASRIALIGRDLLTANKRVVNEGVELMGRARLERFAALNDAVAHRSPEAREFSRRAAEVGLGQAARERDEPFRT